jgi:4-hydroxy-3-methylbut-2-enyl diphosphate reductase
MENITVTNSPRITVAANAGFCSGVKRAFDIALRAARLHGRVCTLGRLVHNDDAVRFLEERGVYAVDSPCELPPNTAAVIRSHGVGREVYEQLAGRVYYDATCVYVKRIHEIVSGYRSVIIAGDESHPEVRGVIGNIGRSIGRNIGGGEYFVVGSADELNKVGHSAQIIVAQTTFNEQKWRECTEFVQKHCTNTKIFDTICNATVKRQNEARRLSQSTARECGAMIVIGSPQSSNSVKLYEICREQCEQTFFIANAGELNKVLLSYSKRDVKIGITAGASVPAEIIKEVHSIMNEENKILENESEFDFMAEVDKTFPQKIYQGKRVKAFVVKVNSNEVAVDLGTKHTAYIPADEVGGAPGSAPEDVVKVGDEIECIVTKVNDAEGVVYLSKKSIDSEIGYEKLAVAYEAGAVLEAVVTQVVNSGVIVTYEGTRVFVPASQSGVPKSGNLETLLKKTVKFKVIEISEQRKRLIGSIRAASRLETDALREKFWAEIEIGKHYKGEVKSMESYGVFVDLGGVDGMVHLSELSWKRIRHPKDAVQVGDMLDVFVKSFDPDKKRVSLTAKNAEDNPWTKFIEDYPVGTTVKATVVNITPFGAFAQITPGIDGLIHVSQISRDRVKNVNEAVQVGQEVDVRITEIDAVRERVSISVRALYEDAPIESEPVEAVEEIPEDS